MCTIPIGAAYAEIAAALRAEAPVRGYDPSILADRFLASSNAPLAVPQDLPFPPSTPVPPRATPEEVPVMIPAHC